VQRRTATKDVYPGFYDVAAGGVVLAGETYEESAAREAEEEMGIRGAPMEALFDFFHEDGGNRVWGRAFRCVWDGPVVLQPEEVEEGAFRPVAEILRLAETEPAPPTGLWCFACIYPRGAAPERSGLYIPRTGTFFVAHAAASGGRDSARSDATYEALAVAVPRFAASALPRRALWAKIVPVWGITAPAPECPGLPRPHLPPAPCGR